MSSATIRLLSFLPVTLTLVALCSCGSSTHNICPAGSSGCQANAYLLAAGLDGQLTTFTIDPTSGAVGSSKAIPGPQNSFGMAALGALYVSDPSLGGISSIDAWTIDLSNGNLTAVPGSPFQLGPFSLAFGLAANSHSQVLYVADSGTIDALKVNATGALSPIAGSPFPAGSNLFIAIDPQDRFLFAADNTTPGNVLAFTIDSSTGALTPVPGSPFQIVPNSNTLVGPGEIVVDGGGQFVYVALTRTNQIAGFHIDQASGALTPVPGSPFNTGNGTIMLAAVNEFLYVPNGSDGTISGYSINTASGVLTPVNGSPFPFHGGALAADATGRLLYTSGSAGLLAFSIDQSSGALTEVGLPVPYPGAFVMTIVP